LTHFAAFAAAPLAATAVHMTPSPPPPAEWPSFSATVGDHAITVIPAGPERLATLIGLIDDARVSIDLLFYIYADDASGTAVRDALTRAALRRVRVSMLIDSFGSAGTADSFFTDLRAAGGSVRWLGTRWTPRYLIRNHQKLVVADGRIVMAGGFNIADDYFAPASDRNGWHDLAFTLTGPAVMTAAQWFDALEAWAATARPRFRELRRLVRTWRPSGDAVSWQVGGPTVRLSPWARCLRGDMAGASAMALSMAYFAPNAGMVRRIGRIARSGGRVQMVLPARSDNAATVGAARLLYGFLLKRGVAIAEYEPQRLHAKLIVIDDIVLIGSANLDMRSLYVNMELMLRVRDPGFAAQCRALIGEQQRQATPITPELHRSRAGPLTRLRWFASWLIVAVIDYSITRRLNFGLRNPD
jgi:cardiolipin synthase A/B